MTTISSVSGLQETIYEMVKATSDNAKRFEKNARRLYNAEFENSFEASGGPYRRPTLRSPSLSDDDASEETRNGGVAPQNSPDVVTTRSAYGATLMLLCATVEVQAELAKRVQAQALSPMTLKVVADSRETFLRALEDCYKYVYRADATTAAVTTSITDPLAKPSSAEVLVWMQAASEVERRSRALLAWVKLKGIGGGTVEAVAPAGCTTETKRMPGLLSAAAETMSLVSTAPASLHHRGSRDSDDDNHYQREFHRDWMDATELLNEVAEALGVERTPSLQPADDEVSFNLPPSGVPIVPRCPEEERGPFFDPATVIGRRNIRAKRLLRGVLKQTDEEMSSDRHKFIAQLSSLRDLMCTLGKTDYNILTFQVRSWSQQVGESGPVLWTAALDICVSEKYTDVHSLRKPWMEERIATEPLAPNEQEQYTWVELIQSEACVRGSQAKMGLVPRAAKLLFPREMELYRSLGNDDALGPVTSPEWNDIAGREVGKEAPFGRFVTFQLDRTSFIAQALQLMQKQRPNVGTLTIDITEGREEQQKYTEPSELHSYTVRICSGDGKVLALQSSKQYNELYDQETLAGAAAAAVSSPAPPMKAALVPTVFDALYKLAEKLEVLEMYLLLKKSFERLRLPLANEPREYVLNYFSLIFGMHRLSSGVLKDTVTMLEKPVTGGWCITVRLGYPRTPIDNTMDFQYINLQCTMASTKKAARNEALLSVGKTNFTPEILRMLDYGTVPQKAHAEYILMVNTPAVIPMSHSLQEELAKVNRFDSDGSLVNLAPGEAVARRLSKPCATSLSPCDEFISHAIKRHFPHYVQEVKACITQSHPALLYTVETYADVMETFFATLPRAEQEFGRYVFPSQDATRNVQPSEPEEPGKGAGFVRIVGRSPIQALYTAMRLLRDRLDGATDIGKAKEKEAKPIPDESSPADTTTTPAATSALATQSPYTAPSHRDSAELP